MTATSESSEALSQHNKQTPSHHFCSAPRDIAKYGIGKVGGEKEGESGEQRWPDSTNHRAYCLQAHAGGLGFG